MEFVFELLLELILEGCISGSQSKKVPLYLRIILGFLVCLFFFGISSLLITVGVHIVKSNIWAGLFILAVGGILLIGSIYKIYTMYVKKTIEKE